MLIIVLVFAYVIRRKLRSNKSKIYDKKIFHPDFPFQ